MLRGLLLLASLVGCTPRPAAKAPATPSSPAPDLSSGTATAPPSPPIAATDPTPTEPACAPQPERPRLGSLVSVPAALAAVFNVDERAVPSAWTTTRETPWLPRVAGVAAGRLGETDARSVGVLVFDWCDDRPDQPCYGAHLQWWRHDRVALAAIVDLRGEPGPIPLQQRAPVFTAPDDACTRMPALVVVARGRDGDSELQSVALVSLTGDDVVLYSETFSRGDGGVLLQSIALVDGPVDAPLDLDVTTRAEGRKGSRCARPEPLTIRHRLAGARYVRHDRDSLAAQLRSGCS